MKKQWNASVEINDFKIIKDFGRMGNDRPGIARCKLCGKRFRVNLYRLKRMQSCGCYDPQLKPLSNNINGFNIIRDLGCSNGKRWAIAECKICNRHYKVIPRTLILRKSCGCLRRKKFKCSYRMSHPRLICIYKGMKERCYNKFFAGYKIYGAKGITVCNEWLKKADSFCEWSIRNGYMDSLTIDRIDGTKGYMPSNCRWVTITENSRNRKNVKLSMEMANQIRKDRVNMKVSDLMNKYNVCRKTIQLVVNNEIWKSNG
jgi:hypothetical protein